MSPVQKPMKAKQLRRRYEGVRRDASLQIAAITREFPATATGHKMDVMTMDERVTTL